MKSGTADHDGKERNEGMREALEELATFCDRELRLKEDKSNDFVGLFRPIISPSLPSRSRLFTGHQRKFVHLYMDEMIYYRIFFLILCRNFPVWL